MVLSAFRREWSIPRSRPTQVSVVWERFMSYTVNSGRRRFLGAAAMTLAATQLDVGAFAETKSATSPGPEPPPVKPGTSESFASLKQINAGLLSVGYVD